MDEKYPWSTVAVAAIGVVGTIAGSMVGYKSGSMAVDKDYVQMAISSLAAKDTSPELRSWSVEVLNKLAPVPFGPALKRELVVVPLTPRVPIPKEAGALCPDIIGDARRHPNKRPSMEAEYRQFVLEYELCRVRHKEFVRYIRGLNQPALGAK